MNELRLFSPPQSAVCAGSGFVALDMVEVVGDRRSEYSATGGSCGNVLTILAWLGWRSYPVARLGADAAHDIILKDLSHFNVKLDYVSKEAGVQTPIVIHRISQSANREPTHRFLLACPECGGWLPRYRPILLKTADEIKGPALRPKVFYFDRPAPGVLKLARRAKEEGALILFEPSSVGDERHFKDALSLCHVLKYSNERLGHLSDLKAAHDPLLIIETLGRDGLQFRWKDVWTKLEAFPVVALKDAAGAGDWCTAGFLHAIGQTGAQSFRARTKAEIVHGLRLGQALAAINCQFDGARGAMYGLSRRQLDKYLSGYPLGAGFVSEREEAQSHRKPAAKICHVCATRDTSTVRKTRKSAK